MFLIKKILFICLALSMLMVQTVLAAPEDRAEFKVRQFSYEVIEKTQTQPRVLRIEIGLNKATENFRMQVSESNPNQLILEMDKTKLGGIKKTINLDGQVAKSIQFIPVDKVNSHAVITLPKEAAMANYKVYTLPKDNKTKKPFRIVIDLIDGDKFNFTAGLEGKLILIDPGHGGSDPGAIGSSGVREKQVALDVSLKVEELLKQAGAKVIMTRRDDRDVFGAGATDSEELAARVNVGKRNPADVFVSIHANSFTRPSAHGTATYYYKKTQYDTKLAEALQNGMVAYGGRYNRGTSEANFYVVKRSTMPAALVELAFISNPTEERLLNSIAFQQKLAEGICKGLSDFFKEAA